MNGIVIGLGSMGKRRLRLIKKLYPECSLAGVDASLKRCSQTQEEFGIPCFQNLKQALEHCRPEVGFVCTSPISHYEIIRELLLGGVDVFTELNLMDTGYEELEALAKQNNKTLFLSSTPLYRREIQLIAKLVAEQNKPLSYRYHVGQYLPDWHPWEKIQDFFVFNPKTNGCREIFAIQLPWMLHTFGPLKENGVLVSKGKISDLPLEYDDSYLTILEHQGGHHGVFVVDVVARKPVSNLEIVGESLQIRWDGTPDGLYVLDLETKEFQRQVLYPTYEQDHAYAANIIEDAYGEEIRCFMESLQGKAQPRYTFQQDKKILKLIDRIEG